VYEVGVVYADATVVEVGYGLGPVILLLEAQALNLDVRRDAQQVLRVFYPTHFTIMFRTTIAIMHDDGLRTKIT